MSKQELGNRQAKPDDHSVVAPVNAALAPDQLLAKALERDINPDVLSRMMDLYERHEHMQAERQYVTAMAAFKADPPAIRKTKHVSYASKGGKTDYHHAPLDEVVRAISVAMSPHGLSFRWRTQQLDGLISVTCVLQHVGGHSEEVTLQASPDQSGGKNSIQAVGSTVTYLQRYTLLAATGLAAEEQDDDGQAAAAPAVEHISAGHLETVKRGLNATGTKPEDLLHHLFPGVHNMTLEQIPEAQANEAIALLKQKYEQQVQAQIRDEQKPEPEVKF